MKKSALLLITAFVLSFSQAHALPSYASGAGGAIKVENSQITNRVDLNNEKDSRICTGLNCNMAGGSAVSGAGVAIDVKNSTIRNEIKSSGGKGNKICASLNCNMGSK